MKIESKIKASIESFCAECKVNLDIIEAKNNFDTNEIWIEVKPCRCQIEKLERRISALNNSITLMNKHFDLINEKLLEEQVNGK